MLQIRVEGLDPAAIIGEITEDIQRRRAKMVTTALNELKWISPVLYGFFRANWIPCRDGNAGSLAGAIAAIPPARSKDDASVQAARGIQESAESVPLDKVPLNEDLVLFDNQTYGPALNNGSSRNAPRNFVEHSLELGVSKNT